jgi:DNA-binding MarR family transcriptional regulator
VQTPSTSPPTSAAALARELLVLVKNLMKSSPDDFLELVAELDLTIPQMRALFCLNGSAHALALTELAPRIGLSVAAAGRAVDGLVRNDLVTRSEDPADRRIKRLALTERGSAAIENLARARFAGMEQFTRTLSQQERDDLSRALAPLLRRLGDEAIGQAGQR